MTDCIIGFELDALAPCPETPQFLYNEARAQYRRIRCGNGFDRGRRGSYLRTPAK
jgi:hypothetical protein